MAILRLQYYFQKWLWTAFICVTCVLIAQCLKERIRREPSPFFCLFVDVWCASEPLIIFLYPIWLNYCNLFTSYPCKTSILVGLMLIHFRNFWNYTWSLLLTEHFSTAWKTNCHCFPHPKKMQNNMVAKYQGFHVKCYLLMEVEPLLLKHSKT